MKGMNIMDKEKIKYAYIDNIMSYLKYQLLTEIEENNDKLPIFNSVLTIMHKMNKYCYSYTLKDIDDTLFDKLIEEIISVLN